MKKEYIGPAADAALQGGCDHEAADQWFVCLEHSTYLMECSKNCDPTFYTTPDLAPVAPLRGGWGNFLWQIFERWRIK